MPVYPFKVGRIDCASLVDNSSKSELRKLFPDVPELEFQEAKQSLNFAEVIEVGFNCLYLNHATKHILVDTGTGQGQLLNSLAELGLLAQDIDLVILTHGDRDHIGGVLDFPNAQFVLSQKMFDAWAQADLQEQMVEEFVGLFRDSLAPEDLEARAKNRRLFYLDLLPQIQDRLSPVAFEQDFLSGFRLLDATGHRSDHTALEIESEGQTLLHVVDSIRHPVQIQYNWASFIDSYPQALVESNKRLFERALKKDALVFGSHLSFPGLAHLKQTSTGLEWQQVNQI